MIGYDDVVVVVLADWVTAWADSKLQDGKESKLVSRLKAETTRLSRDVLSLKGVAQDAQAEADIANAEAAGLRARISNLEEENAVSKDSLLTVTQETNAMRSACMGETAALAM